MSEFSNLASGATAQAGAYVQSVLALVGNRDPLDILTETPAELASAVSGLSSEAIRKPERDGAWSIAHVLQHLADSELVWGYRMRRVLTEDEPRLSGFDQDLWADRLGYHEAEPRDSIDVFRVNRQESLRILSQVRETDLDRAARHAERGTESLRFLIRLYAGHDLVHRLQIDRIRNAVST